MASSPAEGSRGDPTTIRVRLPWQGRRNPGAAWSLARLVVETPNESETIGAEANETARRKNGKGGESIDAPAH
jgi:hypothetical protein